MSFLLPQENSRAQMVMQHSELESKAVGRNKIFHCNPLLLDGEILNYNFFSIKSEGMLTVVEGVPASASGARIPFRVYLRRDGKLVENEKTAAFCKPVYEVDLSEVLSQSKIGDDLMIVPVNAEDWKAKRILKILEGREDGC